MLSFLNKPYPYNIFSKKDFYSNLGIGCFVALFLIVFQPFDISLWQTNYKALKISGFGLVSFLCPFLFKLCFDLLFKSDKREDHWVVWKEIAAILFVLLLITTGNLIYSYLITIAEFKLIFFMYAFFATILLAIFPVSANVFFKHQRYLKLNNKEAQLLEAEINKLHDIPFINTTIISKEEPIQNTNLDVTIESKEIELKTEIKELETEPKEEEPPVVNKLILIAENEKDTFELLPHQLLYIESTDNYSSIIYVDEHGKIKKELIRSSLKRLETQITIPSILRCHRAYIVNLSNVAHITGNAQGYRISFSEVENTIPVSRNYGKVILETLKNLNKNC